MSFNTSKLNLAAAVSFAALVSPAAPAASSPCNYSATLMAHSCQAERKEEFNAVIARCNSISSADERNECKAMAKEERKEAVGTCADQKEARIEVCDALGEGRYMDPLVDPDIEFIDPDDIGPGGEDNNPYVILEAGHTHVLRSEEYDPEEDESSIELIVVYATDEVREIEGVDCRVVVDIAVEPEFDEDEGKWEFEPVEVTDDWFAQDTATNVYYCGEIAQNFEDGVLRDLDGSFEAGLEYAEGGVLTLAFPSPGDMHRQEYALGEAEDIVEYLALGADPADEGISEEELHPAYRCTTGGNDCLMTYDSAPLEPGHAEFKYYLAGTGFVLAAAVEDGELDENSGEWLVCEGDSLDVLDSCGFDDEFGAGATDELKEELCDLHDEFCDDGEES